MEIRSKNSKYGLIMAVYLLGIFMGAIDTGIVSPARTIIQNNLGVGDKTGIWMITIYTLAYAASIPIMGKLADRFGRKYIYLTSIFLFALGSLFCGLSQGFASFPVLLAARAVQAIGGGGILPVATAEFGTTFPKEKRGMALGLVGGVYGIANIFGASAGSAIIDLFGINNWQFIFYVNIPISLFILIAGFVSLPNTKAATVKKIDFGGITILTTMVLCLLYGLKNIDFFDFRATFVSTSVYPFLLVFIALLPLFIIVEKKVEDPVINLSYFKNIQIIITLILSMITGVIIMGMIFVPQFAENALKITTGNGGYFVLILGLFAGVGAPFSGKLIDKIGVKIVLGFGFLVSVIGSLFLILVTANYPSMLTVVISLILIGLGIGFTMGTPLNYMMLDNTKPEESNSALATLSLIRSIGTAIAPAIMIGFIAHAGMAVQPNVMKLLPSEVNLPELPYAQELTDKFAALKTNPETKDQFANLDIPDLTSMQTVKISMDSNNGFVMPAEILTLLQTSDVTTIVDNSKVMAESMFSTMTPDIIAKINSGLDSGIAGINSGMDSLNTSTADLQSGYDGITAGVKGMESGVSMQETLLGQLESMSAMMPAVSSGSAESPSIDILSMIPAQVKSQIPQATLDQLAAVKSVEDLNNLITGTKASLTELKTKLDESKASQAKMKEGLDAMNTSLADMKDTISKMTTLKDAIPGAFTTAKENYLTEIESRRLPVETEFQKTMNMGYKQVYFTVTIASAAALIILAFYKKKKEEPISDNT
jgi:EmrB/QacA subfamily drug resistance transporter